MSLDANNKRQQKQEMADKMSGLEFITRFCRHGGNFILCLVKL
jgi:hypothetical protein